VPAALGGGRQAGAGALADELALELRERAEDVEDELPAGARGVDRLGEEAESDLSLLEELNEVDEVAEAAAQPIELPDDDGVPRAEVVEHLRELGTIGPRTARVVDEQAGAADSAQGVDLEVGVLIDGRDPAVAALADRLREVPIWFHDFIYFCDSQFSSSRAVDVLRELGKLIGTADSTSLTRLLASTPSVPLARTLRQFASERSIVALPGAEIERAARRRAARLDATPVPFQDSARRFSEVLVARQQRALRAGRRADDDATIEGRLATVRDFARFSRNERHLAGGWTTVGLADVEAFFARRPHPDGRGLTWLSQFFGWARKEHLVLADPTHGLWITRNRPFSGELVTLDRQRALFARWTLFDEASAHEALVGLLALLHGLSSSELRGLVLTDVDERHRALGLARRSRSLPLDPVSWTAVERGIAHQRSQRTRNPHLIVNRRTRTGSEAVGAEYLRALMTRSGTTLRQLRATRLSELVDEVDPVLVAARFDITVRATTYYFDARSTRSPGPSRL